MLQFWQFLWWSLSYPFGYSLPFTSLVGFFLEDFTLDSVIYELFVLLESLFEAFLLFEGDAFLKGDVFGGRRREFGGVDLYKIVEVVHADFESLVKGFTCFDS